MKSFDGCEFFPVESDITAEKHNLLLAGFGPRGACGGRGRGEVSFSQDEKKFRWGSLCREAAGSLIQPLPK